MLRRLVVAAAVVVLARRRGSAARGRGVVATPLSRGATRSPVVAAVAAATVATALTTTLTATIAVVAGVAVAATVFVASATAVATVLRSVSEVQRLIQMVYIPRSGREGHRDGRRSAWEVHGPGKRSVNGSQQVVALSLELTS